MAKPRHEGRKAVAEAKRRLKGQLKRAGVDRQIEAVKATCASVEFQRRFSEVASVAGDTVASMRDVQRLAHSVLDEMGTEHRGVFLTFSWDPKARGLGIYFRPQRTISQVASAALKSAA